MNQNFPILSISILVLGISAAIYFVTTKFSAPSDEIESTVISQPSPSPAFEAAETPITSQTNELPQATPEVTQELAIAEAPSPSPTPPPLDKSDLHIYDNLNNVKNGQELSQILTDEEIIRKVVRAVYGLSEGRVVRQYRPIVSPEKEILVNKLGQQTDDTQEEIYRIARENSSRYTRYIAIFSTLNNRLGVEMYKFYLPLFEQAYLELGTNEGSFHTTLIKAIDVLLSAPSVSQAILLTRPTVMYKFKDPALEKLPPAHKLMLRMGQENSEALKLELKKFREKLVQINV